MKRFELTVWYWFEVALVTDKYVYEVCKPKVPDEILCFLDFVVDHRTQLVLVDRSAIR